MMEWPSLEKVTHTDIAAYIGAATGLIGAVTGTIALVWNIRRYYQDDKIRIKIEIDEQSTGHSSNYGQHVQLQADIYNLSPKPANIKEISLVAYRERNGKLEPFTEIGKLPSQEVSLPRRLEEKEHVKGRINLTQSMLTAVQGCVLLVEVKETSLNEPFKERYKPKLLEILDQIDDLG